MNNQLAELRVLGNATTLFTYTIAANGQVIAVQPPVFEIDGENVTATLTDIRQVGEAKLLRNGCREYIYAGQFSANADLSLEIIFRIADDNPVIRFSYRLRSRAAHRLTKVSGIDQLRYLGISLAEMPSAMEVRFSEFNEMLHSFALAEYPLEDRHFTHELAVMGPMLVAGNAETSLLLAYEHGSQVPDAFLQFQLAQNRNISLTAVKGNYYHGQVIDADHSYQTIWFQLAAVAGGEDDLAVAYRTFVLKYQTENLESRQPYIFYNTWAFQERNKWWNGQAYLDSMHQERIMQEIEIAHRMGIEVYVLDTGWYEKTGDWRVNLQRFPDGLKSIKAKLDEYGMKLGLWFEPITAALSSRMLLDHPDCVRTWHGNPYPPRKIWETEDSVSMCLMTDYADAFADELIRLVREVGVTYFKWDAIGQYGCDDPRHGHGTVDNSEQERADCYAFQLMRGMNHVVDRLCAACPEAIVDFDITEGHRCVGLGFLAVGKYFLINNGPYYGNYNIPIPQSQWTNIFVHPGAARGWICRSPLTFDKWTPSVLYLTHYLPDDPANSQRINIGSLILGQNGIWGDLPAISEEGVARFGALLAQYKQVRHDITRSPLRRTGQVGSSPEIYEKIDPATGRGAVVIFANAAGNYDYIVQAKVDGKCWFTDGTQVHITPAGEATITTRFDHPDAAIIYFGVEVE